MSWLVKPLRAAEAQVIAFFFLAHLIVFVRRNIIYEEHLMAFFMDNHLSNSCR